MSKKLAVLATGAIGAPIGGLLTRAGHDVTLIDQWPANVEAMKAHGLHVTIGPKEDPEADFVVPVRACHVHEVCTLRDPFDVVFVASKSYDTRWLVQLIEPHLEPDGVVVSVQNSINEEWIAPIVGEARTIGCVLTGGGELLEPGHVWRSRNLQHRYYTVGELHGNLTPRLEEVACILSDAGKIGVTTDLRGTRWSKLVSSCTSAALAALVSPDLRSWQLVDLPGFLAIATQLGKETIEVGAALGYRMEPIFGMTPEELLRSPDEVIPKLFEATGRGTSKGSTNMIQQDIRRGRPTEIVGFFNGLVVRKGKQAGVSTPMNQAITSLFARLEKGELGPSLANLKLLEEGALAQVEP